MDRQPLVTVGRGRGGKVWHAIRKPRSNEGVNGQPWRTWTPGPWVLSLCSHVWEIKEITFGEITCYHCRRSIDAVPNRFNVGDHALRVGLTRES